MFGLDLVAMGNFGYDRLFFHACTQIHFRSLFLFRVVDLAAEALLAMPSSFHVDELFSIGLIAKRINRPVSHLTIRITRLFTILQGTGAF